MKALLGFRLINSLLRLTSGTNRTKGFAIFFPLLLLCDVLLAQIPTISSFTPASGPIGTSVTITGTNFSTTSTNNIVYFGATKAAVTNANATQLIVTVPKGATYQPLSVAVGGLTAYSNKPFGVTFSSSQLIAQGSFTKVDFTTNPESLLAFAIGDIDGDGLTDIGLATNNAVSIYRNVNTSASITTASFAANVNFTTGGDPYSIAFSDLDGDGKLDLVAISTDLSIVSIFRNQSTSGVINSSSFSSRIDFTTGSSPYGVAVGDLDGDGKPDLAVVNNSDNTISVLRNTSTVGSLSSSSFAAKVDFATGTYPEGIAVADLDGDGKPELAVTNRNDNSVSVLKNTSTAGSITSGSFAAKIDFTASSLPYGIAIGDLDGDGSPDIAVTNGTGSGGTSVSVFRNSGLGTITSSSFASRFDLAAGSFSYGIAIGDLDGDGKPDLVSTNFGDTTLSVLKNASAPGSISFETNVDFHTGLDPLAVAIGDLDGDSRPDLLIANEFGGSFSIFQNNISAPIPTLTSFTPTSGAIGTTVTITGTNFDPTYANNIVYFGATRAAVTSGTSTQLTVTVPHGASYQPLTVTVNGLTASSTAPFVVTFPSSKNINSSSFASRVDFLSTPGGQTSSVAICDIDGDGHADVGVSNVDSEVSIFRNISVLGIINATSMAARVDFASSSEPFRIAFGDLDGDGKIDLIATSDDSVVSVFRNKSINGTINSSSFSSRVDFVTGAEPASIAIGDLDGDGKPDLVVTNSSHNAVSVLRNTSIPGIITTSSFEAKVDFTTGPFPFGIAIGDLDGDGKRDLVVTNDHSNTVSILQNISTVGSITSGSFLNKVDLTTGQIGSSPICVAIGDLDGDGKPDLAVSNSATSDVAVLGNLSSPGTITTSSFAGKINFPTGMDPNFVSIGDLDGDGRPELVIPNIVDSTVSVFKNISSPNSLSFGTKVDFATGLSPYSTAIGDMDSDGKPELLVANRYNNSFSIFHNTVSPPIPTFTSFSPTSGIVGTTVTLTGTNFDPTPSNNIVYFGATKATVKNATSTQLTVTVPSGATYQPISVAVNTLTSYSDKPFLITFPGSSTLDATSFASKVDFTAEVNTCVMNIVDIDGDGKPDLEVNNQQGTHVSLFRNVSTSGIIQTGSFSSEIPIGNALNYRSAFGDLDGDGKPDLIIVGESVNKIFVYQNISVPAGIDFTSAVTLPTTSPSDVVIADFDTDGRPDLVVVNLGKDSVSIFKNISNNGILSFSPPVQFTIGPGSTLAAADFNADGKPDLITNGSTTISILRNTSTPDEITTSSFAANIDIFVGSFPGGLAIGDLDNDGKPDLAVSITGNTVAVLRNISGSSTISFAAGVPFSTGSMASSNFESVAIGDLDGDGKLDLVETNYSDNSLSIFKNTSSVSTPVSFASPVNFTTGVKPLGAAIGDLDGDGKPDLAIANYSDHSVSVFQNNTIPATIIGTPHFPSVTNNTPDSAKLPVNFPAYVSSATFNYKPITTGIWQTVALASAGSHYGASISMHQIGEIGAKCYFTATLVDNQQFSSDTAYTYTKYDQGVPFDAVVFGNSASDYNLIALPFNPDADSTVNPVLTEVLGSYDSTQWRLYRNNPVTQGNEEYEKVQAFKGLSSGRAYWLISRNNKSITMPVGQAVSVTQNSPFSIYLHQGWNLIGNPYNFNISWADVQTANTGLGELVTYNGGYQAQSTILNKLSGGFVNATTAGVITIPTIKNKSVNGGRINSGLNKGSHVDGNGDWQLALDVVKGNFHSRVSGVGMNGKANNNFDPFDLPGLNPPFACPGMTFPVVDAFVKGLSRSIVTTSDQFSWDVEFTNGPASIQWDSAVIARLPEKIWLYDRTAGRAIDMQRNGSYAVGGNGKRSLKIVYGSGDYIVSELPDLQIGNVYPNPAHHEVTFDILTPTEQLGRPIQLSFYDFSGRTVLTQVYSPSQFMEEVKTDLSSFPAGFYVVHIQRGDYRKIQKLIITQ